MKLKRGIFFSTYTLVLFFVLSASGAAEDESKFRTPLMLLDTNTSGFAATFAKSGSIDRDNPFFQSLGTNGRSCSSCHQQSDGWSVTPVHIQQRFEATKGTGPIFRLNDGANSPHADVATTEARRKAYSMLLTKGLIRVGIGVPDNAEFELVNADDPYGYASAKELSLFRRPLPSANLKFLSTVMWDARETFKDPASRDCVIGTTKCFASMHFDLASQANDATLGHAQGTQMLTLEQSEAIIDFENNLFTAQVFDNQAGWLTARRAKGGPKYLSKQEFYFGINDVLAGDYQTGAPFNPVTFNLYLTWNQDATNKKADDQEEHAEQGEHSAREARRAVARGEVLFNTKPIEITGVKGISDDLNVAVLPGTCTTCHDTPVSGNHSTPMPLDIGLSDASRRTPDMPLYTLRNKTTHEIILTTDPGRALITGKWSDVGRFKGPVLRSLAARPPYFHNGSANNLGAVVDFYNQRFGIGFTEQEKADLVAFLKAL